MGNFFSLGPRKKKYNSMVPQIETKPDGATCLLQHGTHRASMACIEYKPLWKSMKKKNAKGPPLFRQQKKSALVFSLEFKAHWHIKTDYSLMRVANPSINTLILLFYTWVIVSTKCYLFVTYLCCLKVRTWIYLWNTCESYAKGPVIYLCSM